MQKEFIPYEQALELKELGFDEPCFATYQKGLNGPIMWDYWSIELRNSTNEEDDVECTAPLYQQAFKWFRKKYNLRFCIIDDHSDGETPYSFTSDHEYYYDTGTGNPWFVTPEEAELECLIKLIEIVKEKSNEQD